MTVLRTTKPLCLLLWVTALLSCVCGGMAQSSLSGVPSLSWRIVAEYPHDAEAFTQGLIYDYRHPEDDILFEGTGLYGSSTLRRVPLTTGEPTILASLASHLFGEGITIFNDTRLFQLTWQAGLIYEYHLPPSFGQEGPTAELVPVTEWLNPADEGWGISHDDSFTTLIMSDGTSTLWFLDFPASSPSPQPRQEQEPTVLRTVEVRDGEGRQVQLLNELEWIRGKVYANIWQTNTIVVIDPESGQVEAKLLLGDLTQRAEDADPAEQVDVLNGIAWDEDGQRLFVTGKLWPRVYQLEVEGLNLSEKEDSEESSASGEESDEGGAAQSRRTTEWLSTLFM
ncbi:Glutamine cyclotransferase [Balamuthia mandrillaris]